MQTEAQGAAVRALNDVMSLLVASRKPNTEIQSSVYKKFEKLRSHSEFNQCLAYIFANNNGCDVLTRKQAGVILKGNISDSKVYQDMPSGVRDQLKHIIIQAIGDENEIIRTTVGSLLTTIARIEKLKGWSGVIGMLSMNLNHNNAFVQRGAVKVLETLAEDCRWLLENKCAVQLKKLLPSLVAKMDHPDITIRGGSVNAVCQFVRIGMSRTSAEIIPLFLQKLLKLGRQDEDTQILSMVPTGFKTLLQLGSKVLKDDFKAVLMITLKLTNHREQRVAFSACEFWSELIKPSNTTKSDWFASGNGTQDKGALGRTLLPHLKSLVPMLLQGMIYSQLELACMGEEEKDSHMPDKPQDLAPRFVKTKERNFDAKKVHDEEKKEHILGTETHWSLRKSSANSLDHLAQMMSPELLPVLLPLIDTLLKHKDWIRRESGILALGAVAGSCEKGIGKHLSHIFIFLLNLSKDKRALIRRITCWTLSRFAKFFLDGDKETYVRPLIKSLLERMMDSNKKVQKAACTALAKLHDLSSQDTTPKISPFLDTILSRLVHCLGKYQQGNMQTLYDCIASIAKAEGDRFGQAKYLEILIPKMLQNWSGMESGNYGLFPLLECLSAIALASGKDFQPYAKVIFPQCLKLIQTNLRALKALRKDERKSKCLDEKVYQKFEGSESIVCCVELIGAIYRGGGNLASSLVDPNMLMFTIFDCITDEEPQIRQCALAFLGDITCASPRVVAQHFQQIGPIAAKNLDPRFPSICSNAAWAIGEAAVRIGARTLAPHVDVIMQKLIPIMLNPHLHPNLLHNCAITVSRLGLVCPDDVCIHLEHFAGAWCQNLVGINQPREAEMAYRGLCKVVSKKPQAMLSGNVFMSLCDTIAAFKNPSMELHRKMRNLLHSFKAMLHNRWHELYHFCNPELRYHLGNVYDLR